MRGCDPILTGCGGNFSLSRLPDFGRRETVDAGDGVYATTQAVTLGYSRRCSTVGCFMASSAIIDFLHIRRTTRHFSWKMQPSFTGEIKSSLDYFFSTLDLCLPVGRALRPSNLRACVLIPVGVPITCLTWHHFLRHKKWRGGAFR